MARKDDKHWLDAPTWWKKWKPLRWLAVAWVIFSIVSVTWVTKTYVLPAPHAETEKFTARAADPVLMLDGIKSYDGLDAVRARLEAAKFAFNVTAAHAPASSKYPPHDRDTLVAGKYMHLGSEGQLTLEFFNDRLYEAEFRPKDPDEYAEKLHAADRRLKRDRNGRAEQVIGSLRVVTNVDFAITDVGRNLRTRPYVIWQDMRLVDSLNEWDTRFVALPAPPT